MSDNSLQLDESYTHPQPDPHQVLNITDLNQINLSIITPVEQHSEVSGNPDGLSMASSAKKKKDSDIQISLNLINKLKSKESLLKPQGNSTMRVPKPSANKQEIGELI